MRQVTEQSVRGQTAGESIKRSQAEEVLEGKEDEGDFLKRNKGGSATERARARRCVEEGVYGKMDLGGYPRGHAPGEVIAEGIA